MKITRLVGLTLVTVMALSLAIASAAFAEPLFLPVGTAFTGTSGEGVLEAAKEKIKCAADTTNGTITTPHLAGGITVDFTGCQAINSKNEECTVKSFGATTEGLILTKTLHGVLGLILPKGAGTGVGLLLLPVENKKFVEIESTKCSVATTVTGNVAGEVSPVGVHTTKAKLIFEKSGEGEVIKDFDPSLGGLVIPKLEAFGKEAGEETEESITWGAPVEVS
jgi:hypothetical protein